MSHTLRQIPASASVMVDANIFVYALTPQTQLHEPCRAFFERGVDGAIRLFATVTITTELIHRIMVLEAQFLGLAQRSADAVPFLKTHPQVGSQLTRYRTVLRDLRQANVDILPLSHRDLHASRPYREQHGLLTGDSLIVAVMQREHISFLATNDRDFERIPGIAVWTPGI